MLGVSPITALTCKPTIPAALIARDSVAPVRPGSPLRSGAARPPHPPSSIKVRFRRSEPPRSRAAALVLRRDRLGRSEGGGNHRRRARRSRAAGDGLHLPKLREFDPTRKTERWAFPGFVATIAKRSMLEWAHAQSSPVHVTGWGRDQESALPGDHPQLSGQSAKKASCRSPSQPSDLPTLS